MDLSNLLTEMETFAKAAPPLPADPEGKLDDQAIQQAAAAAGATDPAGQEPDDEGAPDVATATGEKEEGKDKKATTEAGSPDAGGKMTKSFSFELDGGEHVEAYDASDLIKTLGEDMQALRGEAASVMKQQFELIKSQAAQIAALQKQVEGLGVAGRGRKAIVTVTEKVSTSAALAKASTGGEPAGGGMSPEEFFVKAESAQRAGRITAQDVSLAEACLNRGMSVPERIVSRVIGG